MLCNTKQHYKENNFYARHNMISELSFLMQSLQEYGVYVEHYPDVIDFIKYIVSSDWKLKKEFNYIYATTQRGTSVGRDSIIPSLCALLDINVMGSDGYVSSLGNNKYHYSKILESHDIPTPRTWAYNNETWLISMPDTDTKIIVKLTKECASVGIDDRSVFEFSTCRENLIAELSKEFNQHVIVQEFIEGYEVEVPLLIHKGIPLSIFPVGIGINGQKRLGDIFLTYDSIYDDNYEFYDFNSENFALGDRMCRIAENATKILNLDGYARIDFRVDKNKEPYIIDVNHIPHIVEHSSFAYMFGEIGIGGNKILPTLVGLKHKVS